MLVCTGQFPVSTVCYWKVATLKWKTLHLLQFLGNRPHFDARWEPNHTAIKPVTSKLPQSDFRESRGEYDCERVITASVCLRGEDTNLKSLRRSRRGESRPSPLNLNEVFSSVHEWVTWDDCWFISPPGHWEHRGSSTSTGLRAPGQQHLQGGLTSGEQKCADRFW